MSSNGIELEITLVVRTQDPAPVVTELQALDRIGDHTLRREPDAILHDRYFDMPGDVLRSIGFALRLRKSGSSWWLCLKGASQRHGLAVERVEIEGAAGDRALASRMAAALTGTARPARSVGQRADDVRETAARALASLDRIDFTADPAGAMARSGWTLIQDRETLRRGRVVLDVQGTHGIALLAVDTVTYVIAGRPLLHHEVEIEASGGTNAEALDTLSRSLRARFPSALQPWGLSKLRTGVALATLAARRGTDNLATATGDLLPETYALLSAGTLDP